MFHTFEKKRITVLIICPFFRPNIGGVETHLDRLLEYLSKNNYYTVLLTYQPLSNNLRGEKVEKGENYEIHRMQWYGMGLFDKVETKFLLVFTYVFPGLFVKTLIYYLKNHKKIDVIHAHGMVAATIAMLCNFVIKKRLVISTHAVYMFENRKSILRFLVRNILKHFDKILAVSEVSRAELIKIGLPENKIECHRNWVDTDVFKPLNKDEIYIKSEKTRNFLMVSRFIEKKGVLLYLKAAEKIKNADFYLVGGGQLEEEVKKQAEKIPNLKYMGVLNQDVPEQRKILLSLYNLCDYFVSPYLYDEGYSITLCESISCGTKAVVPKRGSPPTFLDDTVAIFMPPKINAEILATTLKTLLKTPKNEKSIKTCREYALKNLGFSNAKIITDSYNE